MARKETKVITGRQITAGAAEETLQISLAGQAVAPSLQIPDNQIFQVGVITFEAETSGAPVNFRLQRSLDAGVSWHDMHTIHIPAGGGNVGVDLPMPLVYVGNATAQTLMRVRVETLTGIGRVGVSMIADPEDN